ncbi:MAG: V-type ATP synthase subunit F [Candidatus Aminicenantes bacterium]
MFEKVAVVGHSDFIFAFKALGIRVFSPKNTQEAREVMAMLDKQNYALVFLHESLFRSLEKERKILSQKFCPVVVGFSDYRRVTDYLERMMKETAIKATGSDSLVRRKG